MFTELGKYNCQIKFSKLILPKRIVIHLFLYIYWCDIIVSINIWNCCYVFFCYCYSVSQPILIGELLPYFNPDSPENADTRYAYICASGLVFSLFMKTIMSYSTLQENANESMKTRIACSSLIFRKVIL